MGRQDEARLFLYGDEDKGDEFHFVVYSCLFFLGENCGCFSGLVEINTIKFEFWMSVFAAGHFTESHFVWILAMQLRGWLVVLWAYVYLCVENQSRGFSVMCLTGVYKSEFRMLIIQARCKWILEWSVGLGNAAVICVFLCWLGFGTWYACLGWCLCLFVRICMRWVLHFGWNMIHFMEFFVLFDWCLLIEFRWEKKKRTLQLPEFRVFPVLMFFLCGREFQCSLSIFEKFISKHSKRLKTWLIHDCNALLGQV